MAAVHKREFIPQNGSFNPDLTITFSQKYPIFTLFLSEKNNYYLPRNQILNIQGIL